MAELPVDAVRAPRFSGCGMCGVVSFSSAPRALEPLNMERMVKSMHHRGPNGNGIYTGPSVSLGHTRLSILDLSENGKQPMTKGEFTITYNGEVYNYPDLRNSLLLTRPNLELTSSTDTEVLLRLLEQTIESHSGEGYPDVAPLLNTLNGFFGFGLWDARRKRLLVVRDRFGIKPVYYYHAKGEYFAFASEVETLLASELFKPVVDLDTLHLFCSISTFFSNRSETLVQGVHSLNPGQYIWIDTETNDVSIGTYYSLPDEDPSLANVTHDEAVAHMKHILEDSIQMRMISDVPLSSFLSGGIDSSVITAIAAHSASVSSKEAKSSNIHSPDHPENAAPNSKQSNAVTAFTISYLGLGQNAGAAADEEYARKVSAHLGPDLCNHKFVELDPMTFTLDDIDELGDLGTFSDDDRLLTVMMNYRAVKKEGFDVILNGQGADEAMGGYVGLGWFRAGLVNIQDPDVPLHHNILDFVLDAKLFKEPLKSYGPKAKEQFARVWEQWKGAPPHNAMKWLFSTSLHRILRFEDYLSMRSAVECRVPILDYRLVDYCFRLPWRAHVNTSDYTGKLVLRGLSKAYLPDDVCERPKQQFPNVNADALNQRLRTIIVENLDAIRACPIIQYIWVPEVFASPEGLDMCSGSDFWVIVIYWRWYTKFASYGGSFPSN